MVRPMESANDNPEHPDDFDEGEMTFSGGAAALALLIVLVVVASLLVLWFRWAAKSG